jgi:hypothetical protein
MIKTVFVAQKTEILQVKLCHSLADFHKKSLILDILMSIDVDIIRS